MSGGRDTYRPDLLVILDATEGTFQAPTFSHRFGVFSRRGKDGRPIATDADEATFDFNSLRVHDLQQRGPGGMPDRRVATQTLNDYDAEYTDSREKDAPYGQSEFFTALNRTGRIADSSGRVALWSSQSKVVDSEDNRYAHALALRSPPLTPAEEADSGAVTDFGLDTSALLPPGVTFHEAGTSGAVTSALPRVSVGGVSFFGGAAVEAARRVAKAGGTAFDVANAASAAARNLPPPPFTPPTRERAPGSGGGSTARTPPPPRTPGGAVSPNNHPLGYVWSESADRVGLLGTFFDPGGAGGSYFPGREGTAIGPLPARHDAQFTMGPETVGRIMFVPNDASQLSEGEGKPIKGSMWFDHSRANLDTEIGLETGQWRPVIRVSARDVPPGGDPPPPNPPPWIHWDPPEDGAEEDLEEETGGNSGGTKTRPRTGSGAQPGGESVLDPRTGDPNSGSVGVQWAAPLGGKFSKGPVLSGSGIPGPRTTKSGDGPGHLAVTPVPGGLVFGGQPSSPITDTGFSGELSFGIPPAPNARGVSGAPVVAGGQQLQGGDVGFSGDVTFGLPGGAAPGGFEFVPQQGGRQLTDAEAEQVNAARATARALARNKALRQEQSEIDRARAEARSAREKGNKRLADRLDRAADRAEANRAKREEARQRREDYKQRKQDEADKRREDRQRRKEEREREREQERERQRENTRQRKEKEKTDGPPATPQGGYMIDVTDPDALTGRGGAGFRDLTPDEAAELLQSEAGEKRRRALLYGSFWDQDRASALRFGQENTATWQLKPMGTPGGPADLQGWHAAATYCINSLQAEVVGAHGGGDLWLSAPTNVVQRMTGEDAEPSRLGSWIVALPGQPLTTRTAPLEVLSRLDASSGATITAGDTGLLTVTREHLGRVTDHRPGVFVRNRTGGVDPDGDAFTYHDERRFAVDYRGRALARGVHAIAKTGESASGVYSDTFVIGSSSSPGERDAPIARQLFVPTATGVLHSAAGTFTHPEVGDAVSGWHASVNASAIAATPTIPADSYVLQHYTDDGVAGAKLALTSDGAAFIYNPAGLCEFYLQDGLFAVTGDIYGANLFVDKVTCDVLDPYAIIVDRVAAIPAEFVAGNRGLWMSSVTNKLYLWDGATSLEVPGAGGAGGADYTLNWLGW